MHNIDERLEALATMSPAQLAEQWAAVAGSPLPRISPGLLRLAIAYEIQAKVFGGLSRESVRRLQQVASGKSDTRDLVPGTRLAREWKGTVQIVSIDSRGKIIWNDREWGSLSEVARAITGTRWSGPAFFGLRQRKAS